MDKSVLLQLAQDCCVLTSETTTDEYHFDLNADIAKAIGWTLVDKTECIWHSPDGEQRQPPLFTTSFDDIIKYLLPKEHDYIVASVNGHVGGTPYAQVAEIQCYADSPQLSFCAACLKAHAELQDG